MLKEKGRVFKRALDKVHPNSVRYIVCYGALPTLKKGDRGGFALVTLPETLNPPCPSIVKGGNVLKTARKNVAFIGFRPLANTFPDIIRIAVLTGSVVVSRASRVLLPYNP